MIGRLKAFWCSLFHYGGAVQRNGCGRINWRCACGRWSHSPTPREDEARVVDHAIGLKLDAKTEAEIGAALTKMVQARTKPDAPLVERLRNPPYPHSPSALREEAADRIEQLESDRPYIVGFNAGWDEAMRRREAEVRARAFLSTEDDD